MKGTMKKIFVTMLMCVAASATFAQTPEEKAALKLAQKEAKAQVSQGIKLRDEVDALFMANQQEQMKKDKANKELIKKNEVAIKEKSLEAINHLQKALGSGHVAEKQLFEANRALFNSGKYVFSPELNKAAAHEPFDTLVMATALDAYCDGCYEMLDKGNPKDYVQRPLMEAAAGEVSRMMPFYSYVAIFNMQSQNLDGSIQAYDRYASFAEKYPKWANEPSVKNPETPASMLASNIYSIAFNKKRFDICEKYYEDALQYENESNNDFIVSSHPLIYLQQGDTAKWIDESTKMIVAHPNKAYSEIAMQNLMAHYSKQGPEAMGKFADDMLAKDPESKMANYGKGYSLFAQEMYHEALPYFQKSVEVDPEYVEGNNMCGMSLYREAAANYFKYIDGKKFKTQKELTDAENKYVRDVYRQAVGYFEKCRELAPDNTDIWAGPLNTIYKNLDERAKAAELEPYLK